MKNEMTIEDVIAASEEVFRTLTVSPLRAEYALQMIVRMCDYELDADAVREMAEFGLAREDEQTPE